MSRKNIGDGRCATSAKNAGSRSAGRRAPGELGTTRGVDRICNLPFYSNVLDCITSSLCDLLLYLASSEAAATCCA